MCKDKKYLLKKYLLRRRENGEEGFYFSGDNFKFNIPGEKEKSEKGAIDSMDLKKLEKEVESCRKCPLGNYRLNPCIGEGDSRAKIMFIGEGPGFSEDHMGRVFVGRAGKLLDKIISGALKRKRSQVYITNIVKCHPMKNPSNPEKRGNDRAPNETEVRACMPYLYRQIKIINPRVIVPLGSPSTKSILKRKEGISRLRGKSYEIEIDSTKFTVVPTYHPAYLLRNNSKKAEVFEDTKLILSLL